MQLFARVECAHLLLVVKQNLAVRVTPDWVLNDAVMARRNKNHLFGPENLYRAGGSNVCELNPSTSELRLKRFRFSP